MFKFEPSTGNWDIDCLGAEAIDSKVSLTGLVRYSTYFLDVSVVETSRKYVVIRILIHVIMLFKLYYRSTEGKC